MLVLSRKVQQTIQIGNNITISILHVKGNVVRVGVQAPRDIRVVRGELPRMEDSELAKTCELPARPEEKPRTRNCQRDDGPDSLRSRLRRRMLGLKEHGIQFALPAEGELQSIALAAGSSC